MGTVKQNCTYIPRQPAIFRLRNGHPSWEMPPDFISAIRHLDAYNLWVCEIVMPIVFQWIEEHKDEVYKDVPQDLKDDIGVVIAKAFNIVKSMPHYTNGLEEQQNYDQALAAGTFNTTSANPLWTQLAEEMSVATDDVKARFANLLGETIRKSVS